ncbi:hypothetical protein K1719_002467 [Acacia pycnantha]|nr:hypothetical protein K1719_002467 [Acacia pycnantha]
MLGFGSIGFHDFDFNHVKKNTLKGKRKGKRSTNENLKFLVIKSIPELQGSIHPFPDKAHVGDLWHLVLELRNPSEFPVKNLKMKISHPRFLNIGNQESMNSELPACLMKKVFFTSEGKGWGLGTKEELPKGAFVCEFVGEILIVKELHERNIQLR